MTKPKRISRRTFIKQTGTGALALSATSLFTLCTPASKLPTRKLGKTDMNVSIISFGGGSQFLLNKKGEWEPMLERAVEAGINFFDTAPDYTYRSRLSSEERYGEVLHKHRDKIYLATKFDYPDIEKGMREFEQSLKKLKTDYVDVLFLHAVGDEPNTLEAIENGNTYSALVKLKQEGLVKYIGFSSMNHAPDSEEILKRYDFDVALLSYNPVGITKRVYGDRVIPLANAKGVGVITIKTMRVLAGEKGFMDLQKRKGKTLPTAKELLQYNLTNKGVTSALIGFKSMEIMEEDIRLAHEIANGDLLDMDNKELEQRVAYMERPEYLPYLDPNYVDGHWDIA